LQILYYSQTFRLQSTTFENGYVESPPKRHPMNTLFLLLTILLTSFQNNEVLPPPAMTSPATGLNGLPALTSPPSFVSVPTKSPFQVGWGRDKLDNAFCMIVQIYPDAVANFSQGIQGQELAVDVPKEIQDVAIQRVIVRVGTGVVERNPLNPQSMGLNRRSSESHVATLSNDRPNSNVAVPIDNPRFNGSSVNGLGNNGLGNNGLGSGLGDINAGARGMGALPVSTGTDGDITPQTDNRQPPFPRNQPPKTDDFSLGSLGRGTADGYASPNPILPPNRSPIAPFGNELPNNSRSSSINPFPSAGNNNSTPPFEANRGTAAGYPGQNSYAGQPNPFQTPGFPNSQATQPYYASTNPNPATPPYLARPAPTLGSNSTAPTLQPPAPQEELHVPDWAGWLPFCLLVSIVVNVYQGMWLSFASTRYKRIVGNIRGVPITELN
jgi:hypothetical protein